MINTETELRQDHAETAAAANDAGVAGAAAKPKPHARGLLAIGFFKLGKAVFFFALGMGALHLVHKNLGDLLLRVEMILHFDTEGQFAGMLQDKVDLVSGHQLRQASIASISYAFMALTEGIGLLMEKTWAEYLTLILTTAALPWEVFEIIKRPTSMRFGLLGVNVLVLAYLLWYLRAQRKAKQEELACGV